VRRDSGGFGTLTQDQLGDPLNWLTVAVHWLHVLFAVTWFGGHIARVLLVEPAVRTLPESAQQQFNTYVERYGTRIFVPVIVGVGVTGVLRGTVFGPIKSLDILLGTPYGLSFLVAVVLGLLLAVPAKPAWMERAHVDHVAFLGVFTAMILMHFGL
jgi:putative copper export protein